MNEALTELGGYISEALQKQVLEMSVEHDELMLVASAAEITRVLAPGFLRSYSKWVRFSKEIMLLSSGSKPLTELQGETS